MTTQLLATELANLIQESKRKHNDLRQAAEKSLEELKSLKSTTEQGSTEELSQKVNFVNPFIIACGTKNAKFTPIAIVCLQRLIVAKALPRSRLSQVLEALMQASSAGLDVQLKILQALPSLLQNYSADIRGDLLVAVLNICFTLQSSKNAIVNHTSAATLQQLVVSVFDKVIAEDKSGSDGHFAGVAPTADGEVELRAAALDAYRIFNDLCLLTENQRPEFIRVTGLSQTFGLELIESVITNHASVFTSHPEQVHVLRVRAMPLITGALKGRPSFAISVRLIRILYTMLRRHINVLPEECGDALEILTTLLDHDSPLWTKALCMEVFRGVFADHALLRRIYSLYDSRKGAKNIFQTLTATFVRLSTERPAVIGLGHQSTLPTISSNNGAGSAPDQAMLEASGVTGIISTASGSEGPSIGISTQFSSVRVPCIDQLDKNEPPSIPESYTYSLTLACISSLSDGLAKFVMPLTVSSESRNRRKPSYRESGRDSPAPATPEGEAPPPKVRRDRAGSFKKNPVPINPLDLEDHPMLAEVQICAAIIEDCWPAILATCSTFLYAALDSDYYHGLVRAFQRFAHVAGLLQLSTPRDAFLTTLGKAAVPPNVFTASLNAGQPRPSTPTSAIDVSTSFVNQAKGLLSSENLTAPLGERQRHASMDAQPVTLNTRNLLCLRALLNLGIALGPTLDRAWRIILETLQQADYVLFSSSKTPGRTPSFPKGQEITADSDVGSLTANFGNEVRAVETAASRLMESTIDFPNAAFVEVVSALCQLLEGLPKDKPKERPESSKAEQGSQGSKQTLQTPTGQHRRVLSFSNQAPTSSIQEDQFALAKLGDIASINMERLLTYTPEESGWKLLIDQLTVTMNNAGIGAPVRTRSAETLSRLMLEAANITSAIPISPDARGTVQLRILRALDSSLAPLETKGRENSVANQSIDTEIHRIVLDGLKSIIEECGENLVSGWEVAFKIIGSVFVHDTPEGETKVGSLLTTRSSKLVRSSFNSLQLIASDFLATLPNSCFLLLVDTLYDFSSQGDDLNIALTTVTFFWVLSDFLSGKTGSIEITSELVKGLEDSELVNIAADRDHQASGPALWMLLLLRLTAVASDDRLELRNSAIQTLLRIFDAYGHALSPEAWSICVRSVIFKLLSSLEMELEVAHGEDASSAARADWNGTAVVVLDGISSLLANYLDTLMSDSSFHGIWKQLIEHMTTLLDFGVLEINSAVFRALGHIVSQSDETERPDFGRETVDLTWGLWSRGVPSVREAESGDNQASLVSYTDALTGVYRLIETDLTVDKVRKILDLLRQAVEEASVGSYASDVEHMTQLQGRILGAVEMIRTDVEGVPAVVITHVSGFVRLAFEHDHEQQVTAPGSRRTFVAMSKASMDMLQRLVLRHAQDKDVYVSGALSAALSALCIPIALKYEFPITTKSVQPWKLASSTALTVLGATLKQLNGLDVPQETIQEAWASIVAIADGILSADCDGPVSLEQIREDEALDIASFHQLRQLIIPSLGNEDIPDKTRKAYAESLFKTSIIHVPSPSDASLLSGAKAGLQGLYTSGIGRTVSIPPTPRTKMAYVALGELFSLVPTDHEDDEESGEEASDDYVRIARTVAPFLILRCGLSLRSYIADQPLRGRMPQPLSQRRELEWILRRLVALRSEGDAIPDLPGVESETRKHLLRLYPLLVKAVGVSASGGDDGVVQGLLGEALEVIGGEFGF